jgi:hypothetical protein
MIVLTMEQNQIKMKDLSIMSITELRAYFRELQPSLRWDLESLTRVELIELIQMHFSNINN